MPTDKEMLSFCFSMLKQLDLKGIDWKLVANERSISNGHAARMRYTRFRAQMEGTQPQHRTTPTKGHKANGGKTAKRFRATDSASEDDMPLKKRAADRTGKPQSAPFGGMNPDADDEEIPQYPLVKIEEMEERDRKVVIKHEEQEEKGAIKHETLDSDLIVFRYGGEGMEGFEGINEGEGFAKELRFSEESEVESRANSMEAKQEEFFELFDGNGDNDLYREATPVRL